MSGAALDPWNSEFTPEFGARWTSLAATTVLMATITGLQPATTYDIRVVAFNAVGVGLASEVLTQSI